MFPRLNLFRKRRRASDGSAFRRRVFGREAGFERLIRSDHVDIAFQPQFELASGRVVGAEALAREPAGRSAEKLFARAAKAGYGERLSRIVQRKALQTAARWTGALESLKLSINLLPADIARPGFEDWLLDEARSAGFAADRLVVEITESDLIADKGAVADRLTLLRDHGVTVAIDDFGTGYSNMAYLSAFPVDLLKIDRGLIVDIEGHERSRIIVQALIDLGRELGTKVLVEGVEDKAQLELLKSWGCDYYQGFLGSRALNPERFAAFVEARALRAA